VRSRPPRAPKPGVEYPSSSCRASTRGVGVADDLEGQAAVETDVVLVPERLPLHRQPGAERADGRRAAAVQRSAVERRQRQIAPDAPEGRGGCRGGRRRRAREGQGRLPAVLGRGPQDWCLRRIDLRGDGPGRRRCRGGRRGGDTGRADLGVRAGAQAVGKGKRIGDRARPRAMRADLGDGQRLAGDRHGIADADAVEAAAVQVGAVGGDPRDDRLERGEECDRGGGAHSRPRGWQR
jgi:hypothetical protein